MSKREGDVRESEEERSQADHTRYGSPITDRYPFLRERLGTDGAQQRAVWK